MPFETAYAGILVWVHGSGHIETNERTGHRVKVARGGTSFRVDMSDGMLPLIDVRKTFPRSAAAEVAWFLMGTQDAAFITKHVPFWDKFVEKLDRVVHAGHIDSDLEFYDGIKAAYGYRWRNHFGRDQLKGALQALRADETTRRVNVSAWDPSEDGLNVIGQRNVPCPTNFTLSITDGELHSSIFLRSSDVFVGLPYDVMGHALLMDAFASELGVKVGVMHVTLAHAHLYEDHWDMTVEALNSPDADRPLPMVPLPKWPLCMIEAEPEAYVRKMAELSRLAVWPAFNPKPFVVE
jgi:thymidylate synthase